MGNKDCMILYCTVLYSMFVTEGFVDAWVDSRRVVEMPK